MGKKFRTKSDPKLAKSHAAGTPVTLVQPALNDLGLLFINVPYFSNIHFQMANEAFAELKKVESEIMEEEPRDNNARLVYKPEVVGNLYYLGYQLVANSYLMFEFLTLDILRFFQKDKVEELESKTLDTKMRFVIKEILQKKELVNKPGYSSLFSKVERIRHNFNHPKITNIYNSDDQRWDDVPMAWIASGKYKKLYPPIKALYEEMESDFKRLRKENATPGTLETVPGIRSEHDSFVKKKKT